MRNRTYVLQAALRQQAKEKTVFMLGHTFAPMKPSDYEGLAGAADNSLICYVEGRGRRESPVLVASPVGTAEDGSVRYDVTELTWDGHERLWSARVVL